MLTKDKNLFQRGMAAPFLILLIIGIVVGVYLVQNKTHFFPKALETEQSGIQVRALDGSEIRETRRVGNKVLPVVKDPVVMLNFDPPQKDSPVKSANFIFQSLLDAEGKYIYNRTCPFSEDGTVVLWDNCGVWDRTSTQNLSIDPNQEIVLRSIDNVVIPTNNQPVLFQSYIGLNGQDLYLRSCPVITEKEARIVWSECGAWGKMSLENTRGVGGESYNSLNNYLISESGQTVLKQSLIDESGKVGYVRSCLTDPSLSTGVKWSECTNWAAVDLVKIIDKESFLSISNIVLPISRGTQLSQSLIDASGELSYYRRCPIEKEGVLWSECQSWQDLKLSNIRGGGNEKYRSISQALLTATERLPSVVATKFKITNKQTDLANATEQPLPPKDTLFPGVLLGEVDKEQWLYVRFIYSDGSYLDRSISVYLLPRKEGFEREGFGRMSSPTVPKETGGYINQYNSITDHYQVTGETVDDVIRSIHQKGPVLDKIKAAVTYGYFEWRCEPEYVTLSIRIVMPEWHPPDNVSEQLSQDWRRYYGELWQHEQGHVTLAENYARRIYQTVSSCSNINIGYQLIEEWRQANRTYDQNTQYLSRTEL